MAREYQTLLKDQGKDEGKLKLAKISLCVIVGNGCTITEVHCEPALSIEWGFSFTASSSEPSISTVAFRWYLPPIPILQNHF